MSASAPETSNCRGWRLAGAATVVLLYLAAVTSHWVITSDSALYLMLGRNLAAGEGYALFGQPNATVPPGYPLLIAGLTRLGLGQMLVLNLAMSLMGLSTIWLSYKMLRQQTTEKAALVATVVVAASAEMFTHSAMQLSDVPFMLLAVGGLYCYGRGAKGGWWLEAGTLALLGCCWVRVIGAALAAFAAVGMALEHGRRNRWRVGANLAAMAAGIALTAAAFHAQYRLAQSVHVPETYMPVAQSVVQQGSRGLASSLAMHLVETGPSLSRLFIGQSMPAAVACIVFGVPTLFGMVLFVARRQWLGVLATAGYIGSILLLEPAIARYLLPVAPLLIIYFLEGITFLAGRVPRFEPRAARIAVTVAVLMAAANLPKDLRLIFRMHWTHFAHDAEQCRAMYATAEFLALNARQGEKFASTNARREMGYISQVPFLEFGSHICDMNDVLDKQDVGLIILGPTDTPARWSPLRQVARGGQFEPIYDNGTYQIYRRNPESALAARSKVIRR